MPTVEESKARLAEALRRSDEPPATEAPSRIDQARARLSAALDASESPPERTARERTGQARTRMAESLRDTTPPDQPAYRPRQNQLPRLDQGLIGFGPDPVRRLSPTGGIRLNPALRRTPPKNVQYEERIRELSGGLLDLPSQGLSDRAHGEARLRESIKFADQTPVISGSLPQDTRNSLLDFAARINHQPPTPSEHRRVLARQRLHWAAAVATGKGEIGAQPDEARAQAIRDLDPDLVNEVDAKIAGHGLENIDRALNPNGPFGDERAAFSTLGQQFFRIGARQQQLYTAQERLHTLTGRNPLPDLNPFDLTADAPPFTVNDLAPAFPELLALQQQASAQAGAEAQSEAARIEEERKLPVDTRVGLGISRAGGVPGFLAKDVAGRLLEYIDAGTGHLLSNAIHWADTQLNSAVPYQQWKSALVRDRLQGLPAGADLEQQYARLLQDFPDVEPDRLRALAGSQLFTIRAMTDALPDMIERQFGFDLPEMVGATDEGFKEAMGLWTGMFDNPAGALLSLGAIPGLRRRVKRAVEFQRQRARQNALESIDNVPALTNTAADLRAKMVDRTIQHIRRGAVDAGDARALMESLTDRLQASGIGITPEAVGTFRAAVDQLNALEATTRSAGKLSKGTRRALSSIEDSFAPTDFYRSEFVLDPANRVSINPAQPSVVVEAARNYIEKSATALKHQADTVHKLAPRARDNRAWNSYRKAVTARIEHNELTNHAARRHARARDILRTASRDLDHRIRALEETAADVSAEISLQLTEHNAGLRTASARAVQLEHQGGTIPEANPGLKTARYRRAAELARSLPAAERFVTSTVVRQGKESATASIRINNRGIDSIGGPDLVRAVKDIFDESKAESGRITRSAQQEAARLVQEAAIDLQTALEKPIERPVPPRAKARTKALADISRKIEEATEAGKPATLTPAELAILNDYRPANAQINPQFAAHNKALLSGQRELARRLERHRSTRALAEEHAQLIDELTPGTVRNYRIPKRLAQEIEDLIAEDTTGLLYNKRTGLSLSRPDTVLRGDLALWQDLRRDLPQEIRLLRQRLIRSSAIELAALPVTHQITFSEQFMREARRRENESLREAAHVIDSLNRHVAPAERIAITEAIRDGDTGRLRGDAAEYAIHRMQALRGEMLDFDLSIGRIGPAQHAKLSGARYTHDTYVPKPELRERLRASELSDLSPSQQLQIVGLDSRNYYGFARPEDSFWIEWRDQRGRVQHQKGFADIQAAERWARSNLPDTTKRTINPPVPRLQKLAEGLELDPGLAFGDLMKHWTRDQAKYLWQRQMSLMPDTHTSRQLQDLGLNPSELRAGRVQLDGREFFRVDDPSMPHLRGRWLPTEALTAAGEVFGGQGFFDALISEWRELRKSFSATKTGRILTALNNVASTAQVTINPGSYAKGWMGNAFYAHNGGFSPLNPRNLVSFLETVRQLGSSMGRDGLGRLLAFRDPNQVFSGRKVPDWLREMTEDSLIHIGETMFDDAVRRAGKAAAEPAAIMSKIEDIQRRIAELDPDDPLVLKSADRLAQLETELAAASQTGFRHVIRQIGTSLKAEISGQAGAPGASRLWNSYALGSGDTLFKAAHYRHMREVQGLSRAEAAQTIRDHYQMFHDPQTWNLGPVQADVSGAVKRILPGSDSLGATRFLGYKTEQARIMAHVAQRQPGRLLQFMLAQALWNSSQVRAEGKSLEEYLYGYALDQGYERSPLTDAWALTDTIILGRDGRGKLDGLSADHIYGNWWSRPFGGIGGAISDALGADSSNPTRRILADTLGGTVGGLTLGNVAFQLIGSVLQGQTLRGTPVGKGSSGTDWLEVLSTSVLPSLFAPGSDDNSRLVTALQGRPDIDPQTWEPRDPSDLLGARILGIREVGDPWRQVSRAMHFYNTHHKEGFEPEIRLLEARRDSMAALVARGAVDPKTGRIADPAAHREVVRDFLAGKARFVIGPGGTKIPLDHSIDSDEVQRAIGNTSLPLIANRFRRAPYPAQITTYAQWRMANPRPLGKAKEVDDQLKRLILLKTRHGRPNTAALKIARDTISAYSGHLEPDALATLRQLHLRMVQR